ncbi:MAG: hypothetical protein ONB48_16735 [candidate division KSB1 bacterium]|nr:hypothetical protein [candidate division KSB1 bacterium]MDZ7275125.1 hypothetical protein [candidate division KSB1 bacterium]MDZ7287295.1 hypothetical protein [candidate division KSB1 bacterium]MDZ7299409.1 hypothetical protein [candidate division KSB1 bacterium]MDZ7308048.1 hypothetical protein [candidate division KSB1 bacterium]
MNLGMKVVAELAQLRRGPHEKPPALTPLPPGGWLYEDITDGIHLKIELADFDRFGYLVNKITAVRTSSLPAAKPVKELLAEQAAVLEQRVTYLLESFRLIELDETTNRAQVRSATPYREAEAIQYYEALLEQGGVLVFSRYAGSRTDRALQPFHVTDDVCRRLLNDLAAALLVS